MALLAGPALAATPLLADEDTQKAGPLALLVILILVVACYFLFKSMSRHLRRVREDFPFEDDGSPAARPAPEKTSAAVVERPPLPAGPPATEPPD